PGEAVPERVEYRPELDRRYPSLARAQVASSSAPTAARGVPARGWRLASARATPIRRPEATARTRAAQGDPLANSDVAGVRWPPQVVTRRAADGAAPKRATRRRLQWLRRGS